ncbi:MAG: flagellar protein FlaG, partial [Spirochaetaceae bacterium]|nr:flagellar protein FlaG [Spirochaetaceae bacterium]
TDKVIKQIPSEELQKLHDNLQEALGILFDQEI